MAALPEERLPPEGEARSRFVQAMDRWDEPAADAAVSRLARVERPEAVFELFWRYGARDFRDIGHKAIYVANAWRTLHAIGWRHAEPVVRSLAYALLSTGNDPNPAKNNHEADIPGRENLQRLTKVRKGWVRGKPSESAARELLVMMRTASAADASAEVVKLLNREVDPSSVWDGLFLTAGEQLMRQPGIVGLHCLTTVNALHFGYQIAADEDTRKFLMLQAAAFLPMFRSRMNLKKDLLLDTLEKADLEKDGKTDGVAEIFADVSRNKEQAARKVLDYLDESGSPERLMAEARRLIFAKGTDSHDYKYSSAVLEDYYHVSPALRPRFLAASVFWLRGSGDRDNGLIERTRAALAKG